MPLEAIHESSSLNPRYCRMILTRLDTLVHDTFPRFRFCLLYLLKQTPREKYPHKKRAGVFPHLAEGITIAHRRM
jgi:hypothetical protein